MFYNCFSLFGFVSIVQYLSSSGLYSGLQNSIPEIPEQIKKFHRLPAPLNTEAVCFSCKPLYFIYLFMLCIAVHASVYPFFSICQFKAMYDFLLCAGYTSRIFAEYHIVQFFGK